MGLVKPQSIDIDKPLKLKNGRELSSYTLVYETYGKLNAQGNNAILICHALSGNHHAAGYHSEEDKKPGWWDALIGPGKAVDTDKFFVVALNNLGGCHGSSGPCSIKPGTQEAYGASFPQVVVEDWVATQVALSDHLGIGCWAAVMGGSLGGMQAIQWAIDHPARLKSAVLIATTLQLHSQNIAFNEIARQAIMKDPNFHDGDYLLHNTKPTQGLWLARMLGHITYLSEEAMLEKFGRTVSSSNHSNSASDADAKDNLRSQSNLTNSDIKFEVENYLNYQGAKFAEAFDANTYLLMTRALDYFDPTAEHGGDLTKALAKTNCSFLVVSFSSDWRFSSAGSRAMVDTIIKSGKRVAYSEIQSTQGHDSFLMPLPSYVDKVKKFLDNLGRELDIN